MAYNTDVPGKVFSTSTEFGGYGGDQDAFFTAISQFLNCPVRPSDFFRRGDVNVDATVNIADAVSLLNSLFVLGPPAKPWL